jgi:hypothetical protein
MNAGGGGPYASSQTAAGFTAALMIVCLSNSAFMFDGIPTTNRPSDAIEARIARVERLTPTCAMALDSHSLKNTQGHV